MTFGKEAQGEQVEILAGDGDVTLTGPGCVVVLSPEAAEEASDQLWKSAMLARRQQRRGRLRELEAR